MIKQQFSGFFLMLLAVCAGPPAHSESAPTPLPDKVQYADLADRAIPAEIVAKVRVMDATEMKAATPATHPATRVRVYLEAEIIALIKGPQGLAQRVSLLADLPLDARGRLPKIKKTEQLIFARSVPQRSGFVQLIGSDTMLDWTVRRESLVRAILASEAAPDSPPKILGIDSGFSVAGTVAGERETQIFLATRAHPVSLTISRRAGEAVRWSVALGEIADEGAKAPTHDSLLWYELACHLPTSYPEALLATQSSDTAEALRADYSVVLRGLGACARALPVPMPARP
jgi:hypothetical protein